MKHLPLCLVALVALMFQATPSSAQNLIASYNLFETATDGTGNYADVVLTNAPYEDGGVYVNGNYAGSDPDSSDVRTPYLTGLTFASLTVSVDFKIASPYTTTKPIIICGGIGWRWLGAQIQPDGRLQMYYNNTDGPLSTGTVTTGVWHRLTLTYDGSEGRVYLDGTLEATQAFALVDGNDRVITTSNGANGRVFKGHLRNLKVYNGVTMTSVDADPQASRFALHQNTPNPFNPVTSVRYDVASGGAHVTLRVYDATGRLVDTLVDRNEAAGPKAVTWDGRDARGELVATGVYFCRLSAAGFEQTRKMVLIK